MLTDKLKDLFQFVDFLHSQIDFLLSKQTLINETNELLEKRGSLRPSTNYKAKIEYDLVHEKFCKNFDTLNELITIPFKQKIEDLNIANIGRVSTFINATSDLHGLTRNFNKVDVEAIHNARTKYIEFRSQTNKYHCGMPEFFNELDVALKGLFQFFSDNDGNGLEVLKTETTEVQNLGDAVRLIQRGYNGTIQLNQHITQDIENKTTDEPENSLKDKASRADDKIIVKPTFSVWEWATIFYYADEARLLPANSILKNRMTDFMREYQIRTSFNYFKGRYYNAKKRINETHDYPIKKLRFVMPFIKKTYKLALTNIENDIFFLEEESKEY